MPFDVNVANGIGLSNSPATQSRMGRPDLTSADFLRLMTENALQCQPPLGLIRDFVYDNNKDFPHTIDLKMHGARPFVDAARIFALANNVAMTSTAQRLRGAAEATNLGADVEAMIEATAGSAHPSHVLVRRRFRHRPVEQDNGRQSQGAGEDEQPGHADPAVEDRRPHQGQGEDQANGRTDHGHHLGAVLLPGQVGSQGGHRR